VVVDQPVKRATSGYVLVVVLLLGGLIAASTAAWARHFLARQHTSSASLWVHESREAAGSGVAWARQRLASGGGAGTAQFTVAGHAVEVDLWEVDADRMGLRVSATSDGLGATVEGEALVRGLACEVLPSLTSAAAAALGGDALGASLSGTQTLTGQTFAGTLVLERGAAITLEDVVVQGAIVSRAALVGPPYAADDAVTLVLRSGVRVGPSPLAPGVGLMLPDGSLTVEAGCSIEVQGAIVAGKLDLQGDGACDGHVVSATTFGLPAGLDRPGFGRVPPEWPEALDVPALGLSSLAFPRHVADDTELGSIGKFTFTAAK
jgi:hypothetical protein